MADNEHHAGITRWLARVESRFDNLLAFLSMLAVALVVSGEMVNASWHLPFLDLTWSSVQVFLRSFVWLVFVSHFIIYAVISKRPMQYARTHLLELIICLGWVPHYPHYSEGYLNHLGGMLNLGRLVPLDVLQLAGSLAHAWRVVRWTAQRFRQHPVFVTGSAAMLLVASASALLNHFEPQTFPTFWDGAWYSLVTITTIGYGDLVPHTTAGKVIGAALIISGISLAGVFIGLISESVRARLLKGSRQKDPVTLDDIKEDILAHKKVLDQLLSERQLTSEALVQLLAENKETNALLRRLLENNAHAATPLAPPPEVPTEGQPRGES
jgi:voltage-gated potassium channel